MKPSLLVLTLTITIFLVFSVSGQTPAPNLKIKTNLVTLEFSAWTRDKQLVTEIDPRKLEIWDNKIRQEITFFRATDDPYATAFVCDTSGSMGARLKALRSSIRTFTQYAHPKDQYTLIAFNRSADVLGTDLSPEEIINRSALFTAQKQTCLYDAMQSGIKALAAATYTRRAMILISDGQDNASRTTLREIKQQLDEASIRLFVVDVSGPPDLANTPFRNGNYGRQETEMLMKMGQQASLQQQGKDILTALAEVGGGTIYDGTSDAQIEQAAVNIAIEMRRSFSVGFTPTEENQSGMKKKMAFAAIEI